MKKQQLSFFGEIDLQNLKEEYISSFNFEGKQVKIDLNFFDGDEISEETFSKTQDFLNLIEDHIRNAYTYLGEDYDSEGETYGYIEHHAEELPEKELQSIIGKESLEDDALYDNLFEYLQLQRIGIFPEDTDEFAVFDFSIGEKHTEYVIAIFVNSEGVMVDLGIES
ncbi:MAG: DUF2004 domain-containing protein [Chitinophagales bacterium]|nr:DUF2004 domain-containing protein [Chitinophagales bacterium]